MKTIKIISYSLLAGLMLGVAVPAVQAGSEQKTQSKTSFKTKVKKVVSSKWFKLGVGVAAFCVAGAGIHYGRIYNQNQNWKAFDLADKFGTSIFDKCGVGRGPGLPFFGEYCIKHNLPLREHPGQMSRGKSFSCGSEREGGWCMLRMTLVFANRATLEIRLQYETFEAAEEAGGAIREFVGQKAFIPESSVG